MRPRPPKKLKSNKAKIVLGLSGGVDSAASAAISLQKGYDVIGVTCVFVENESTEEALRDAAQVCRSLGIEHRIHRCSELFEQRVIAPYLTEYAAGRTPSPCVGCNADCKIPQLLQVADELGCEHVATGHYARVERLAKNGRFTVKTALDAGKDQSYMLSLLKQEQLARLVLPLGTMAKTKVRTFAQRIGLSVADKGDSQDNCFTGASHTEFLAAQGVRGNPGSIVDRKGTVLGVHGGLERYTLGQRKGIGVGGAGEPYYVLEKQPESNKLVVGFQAEAVMTILEVETVNWQAFETLEASLSCSCKPRYRSPALPCTVEPLGQAQAFGQAQTPGRALHQTVRVSFPQPQPLTAPGQYAAFYSGETLLGAGVIKCVG